MRVKGTLAKPPESNPYVRFVDRSLYNQSCDYCRDRPKKKQFVVVTIDKDIQLRLCYDCAKEILTLERTHGRAPP